MRISKIWRDFQAEKVCCLWALHTTYIISSLLLTKCLMTKETTSSLYVSAVIIFVPMAENILASVNVSVIILYQQQGIQYINVVTSVVDMSQ